MAKKDKKVEKKVEKKVSSGKVKSVKVILKA